MCSMGFSATRNDGSIGPIQLELQMIRCLRRRKSSIIRALSPHEHIFMSESEVIDKLKAHGVLPTSQRVKVAEILLAKPQHMSADQILECLRHRGSGVSKATVYNTLRLFSTTGLVRELNVDASRRFYDSTTHAHHHFYDVDSGELSDIPEQLVTVSGLPPLPEGMEQESVEVLVRIRNKA